MTNPILYKPLLAFVLSMWSTLAGPSRDVIPSPEMCAASPKIEICQCADGAVRAILDEDDDVAPVYTSRNEDLAMLAYFIYRESAMRLRAVGDGGRSYGMLQMRNKEARGDAYTQARKWLAMLHEAASEGRFTCPASPIRMMWGTCADNVPDGRGGVVSVKKLAAQRERTARKLLVRGLAAEKPIE